MLLTILMATTHNTLLVCMAKLIVSDEATMCNNQQLSGLDRTLQGLMKYGKPFGGKILVSWDSGGIQSMR